MVKSLHIILAYATVVGFILRAFWSLSDNAVSQALLKTKAARILPHVIDTALLGAGVALALMAQFSLVEGWLGAKLLGLAAYIGFGVLTLRASVGGRLVCNELTFKLQRARCLIRRGKV